ncbi:MAG TPA: DUF4389 domain-containing protein [Kineosporiaceae bacterium]|nr:DUF4389 domain-containing protein [Kineosporiaceae bacterium]
MSEHEAPAGEQPVLVRGRLDEPLSRWLWLVKWLLLIPHYIVLAFLWLAFVIVTVVAFFAILFTARYPRGLFAFNLGVLRWTWRVSYYGYSALGTDRYPPFSLGEEPDYPATFDVAYPQRLSRGLVLVKWWLLAIPHYLVLGFVLGGNTYTVTTVSGTTTTWTRASSSGLLPLLVFFVAIALLFTAGYHRGLYDLVMGLNRWVLRVVAYVTLMTDEYPPFRLDQGGADPVAPRGPPPSAPDATAVEPPPAAGAYPMPPPTAAGAYQAPPAAGGGQDRGSRAGWIVALVFGLIAAVVGIGLAVLGAGGLWLESRRDAAGYITSDTRLLSSSTPAITAEGIDLRLDGGTASWVSSDRFGTLRIRATGEGGGPVFLGVAPQAALDTWLAPAAHDEVRNIAFGTVTYRYHPGRSSVASPTQQTFWSSSVSGTGTQELRWPVQSGRWGIVLARPDGSAGVRADVDIGASVPNLRGLGTALLVTGLLLLAGGAVLVVVGASGLGRATGRPPAGGSGSYPAPPSPSPRTVDAEAGTEGRPHVGGAPGRE